LEANANEMSDLERMVATEEIKRLKARRDRAVDTKDWALYESLHAPDAWSEAAGQERWNSAADMRAKVSASLEGVTSAHHSHTPEITFESRDSASGIWAMEDNLFWQQGDEEHWLHGFGFYYETYERRGDRWVFKTRRLKRICIKRSAGADLGARRR
jgi:hypothetical protein